jgi:hypothetical protein
MMSSQRRQRPALRLKSPIGSSQGLSPSKRSQQVRGHGVSVALLPSRSNSAGLRKAFLPACPAALRSSAMAWHRYLGPLQLLLHAPMMSRARWKSSGGGRGGGPMKPAPKSHVSAYEGLLNLSRPQALAEGR